MAKAKKVESGIQNWKKKKWVPIVSQAAFQNTVLGETPVEDVNKVLGRSMKINLMSITGSIKNQNINILFETKSSKDGKIIAEPKGYKISASSIKRMIRRGRTRTDCSFLIKTNDEKIVRIKVLLVTRAIVNRSISTSLKKVLMYETSALAKKLDFFTFFNKVVNYRYQIETKQMLAKIYPLRNVEVLELKTEKLKPGQKIKDYRFVGLAKLQEKYKRKPQPREAPRKEIRPAESK